MSDGDAGRSCGIEIKWLRAGYLFIAVFFLSRLVYIASGRIELSEDEAYQWLWSKHLALSYFSKPPLIAYLQFLGTSLWGDNAFGIRFCSPVLAALLSLALLRFVAAEAGARTGFWLVVILAATPLTAVGSTLLTVDSPSVFFWTTAMIAGWRALRSNHLKPWCWTGAFLGLGLLSKYTAVAQILCFALFIALWPGARRHLRRPGPYLALAIAALAFVPVVWWNYQNGWITLTHLKDRGDLTRSWQFRPNLAAEFLLAEFGLLNPVFFVAAAWAAVAFWGDRVEAGEPVAGAASRRALQLYLFCQGAPLFLFYFLYTVRGRVLPNWIAPSIVPLFALMAVYWGCRWQGGCRAVKAWLTVGVTIGFVVVTILHATEVLQVVTGKPIPAKADPLHRVREWSQIAQMLGAERQKLATNGNPVFIIAQHYSLASILSFYLPEAKAGVQNQPLVYCLRSERPENQFYFWPGYKSRRGEDALYAEDVDGPTPAPASLQADFRSVVDLGLVDARYHGQVFRRYQLYWCRDLR